MRTLDGGVTAIAYHLDSYTDLPTPTAGHGECSFTIDYLTAIAHGLVTGHKSFYCLGYNTDIAAVEEDLCEWGGSYVVPPDGGIQMAIQSTSAQDATAGTGIASVQIIYLDDTYAEQTETVTVTGTTAALTVATNILRVNTFQSLAGGSGAGVTPVATGTITVKNTAGTITYAQITAAGNASKHGFYTVPLGYVAFLASWDIGAGGAVANRFVRARLLTTTTQDNVYKKGIFQSKRLALITDAGRVLPFTVPIKLPAKTDIKVSAVDESAAFVSTYIEGWLEST